MKTRHAAGVGGFALGLILSGQVMAADTDLVGAARDTDQGTHPGFGQLDIDGNGVLSEAEAAGAKGLLDHWDQADRNRDGAIERSEFAAFEAIGPMPAPEPAPLAPAGR